MCLFNYPDNYTVIIKLLAGTSVASGWNATLLCSVNNISSFCVKVKAFHLFLQQASWERWPKERQTAWEREKCVSEHWVTLLLNLSTSRVSPQGWGRLDGWGQGVVRGKVWGRKVKGCHKSSGAGETGLEEKVQRKAGKSLDVMAAPEGSLTFKPVYDQ